MHSPIVIIGAARSGTKFLRSVLSATHEIRAVPYDVNYVWRFATERQSDDCLDPAVLTNEKREFIRNALVKLARAEDGARVLEKTVSNTLRVPYVDAVLPEARFVHLIRDGRDVTESAMRQWQNPPDFSALIKKLHGMPLRNVGYAFWFLRNVFTGLLAGRAGGGLWGPRYPGIEEDVRHRDLVEVCALQWRHSVESARSDLDQLGPGKVIEIRYEDLVNSEVALHDLVEFLELRDYQDILQAYRARLRPPVEQLWRNLAPRQQASMLEVIQPTLADLGYAGR